MPQPVLSVVSDLIFATKIFSTAKSLRIPVLAARTLEAIQWHLAARPVRLAVVDLNIKVLDPLAAIRLIRQQPSPPRIVAFLSHVQKELADQARAAGADQVLARSTFTVHLPAILQSADAPAGQQRSQDPPPTSRLTI